LEQRLHQGFQQSVQRQLGLEPEQMQGVREVLETFQADRRELARAQASLRLRLRDSTIREIGEEEARGLLDEMVQLQQRELDLYKNEQARLLDIMAPLQLVRFYQLREELGQRLQQMRQGQGRGLGGGAGGARVPGGTMIPGGEIFR
jgi:hypothetical protein